MSKFLIASLVPLAATILFVAPLGTSLSAGQSADPPPPPAARTCRVEPAQYQGWQAQQMSNPWVQLVFVPQNGGRLIQVIFAGHPYLFVNPKLAGKYLPPSSNQWFNYGGDKIWLLPEGDDDEQHWKGNSDLLDDGPFTFRKLSEGEECQIELTGPADPQTGVQFVRTVRISADSPRIQFHVAMKNISGHTLEWSMQSVSQYDTSDPSNRGQMNRDFWTFTPANPSSRYLNRYHVRFGPAENSAVGVRDDGLFSVHYVSMAAELWLDSTDGWLAVVDGGSQYAMVERVQYEASKNYPGNASVIFWTNGPELRLGRDGTVSLGKESDDARPYYLEAEINSPLCKLRPGESCALDTEWLPTRAGSEFHGATDAGIVIRPLQITRLESGKFKFSASYGVFFPGRLIAHFYDEHGSSLGTAPVADVTPSQAVTLASDVAAPDTTARVSLHLVDQDGTDRGSLQEVRVAGDKR